ncbi:MAG: HPr family phosphocarrier protein [Verrucomicrobia bacterium]|nr:MAG: HPr family phosphocarrier protein [Verrucomicrobiota bacterium]PYL42022.1 MAG: HPr family phosphocarrier protein [Verrucomicrobiota bacterium]
MIFRRERAPMSARREVRVRNKLGLHARPAAHFVKHVRTFRSEIWLVTAGGRYSASSLIEVLRANLDCGANATLEAHGVDAEEAVEQLQKLLGQLDKFDES